MNIPQNWEHNQNLLTRSFEFGNFTDALEFVSKVGEIAEELGHHPDIHLVNYKQVIIETTTHDAGNVITDKDVLLAEKIDQLS